MEEKFLTNKFNFWRAKYYSQNWGNNDIENPLFYMVATLFKIKIYGKKSVVMMKHLIQTERMTIQIKFI